MTRVAEGDVRAFEVVYDRYAGQALGLAMRMMRHPAAAEDVTQEAFLNLWRSAARFEPSRGSLRSWLLRIVQNRGIDAIRRRARRECDVGLQDARAERAPATELTHTTVVERDESLQVHRLVNELPIAQRKVIELAYFSELTHVEVAENLGLPLGTVKGQLRLAHKKLYDRSSSLRRASVNAGRGILAGIR